MAYENLSKHAEHFHLVSDGPNGKEYWAGGQDWVTDPNHSYVSVLGKVRALEWHDRMIKRGINAQLSPTHHDMQLYYWKGLGWVVISALTGKAHMVKFANSRGDGWFIKDVGTIEQTLCINRNKDTFVDVTMRGDQIGEVTCRVEGEVMENFGTFSIPTESNLIYQFEVEVEPVKELP